FYCVQRNDCREFRPADAIDAVYAQTLREAMEKGVEAIAWQADVSVRGICLTKVMPVCV
ncbi:MAG: DNA/RNA nuclease SfsA, partial [Gammaproteobacteria bacterium]|nr:DNA/RNA nuclease SfsA [Gammaproteobacteria bacterium]